MSSPVIRRAVLLSLAVGSFAWADIDNIRPLVPNAIATGGTSNSLGGFGYAETTRIVEGVPVVEKAIYVATFQAGAALRKVTGFDGPNPAFEVIANEGDLFDFYTGGDNTRGVVAPTMFGLVTNPAPVGGFGANEGIWVTDGATTRLPSSTTADPTLTKRLYRFEVGDTIEPGETGKDFFHSLVTLTDLNTAAGTTGSNISRQVAFSPNGQTIYLTDSGSATSGVYKVDPISGAIEKILSTPSGGSGAVVLNTEPAVTRVGDADRIYFRGNRTSAAGDDFNTGGINFIEHDGVNTSGQQVFVSAQDLADFTGLALGAPDVRTMAADADGTIFFNEQTSGRIYGIDSQKRLFKVTTRNERDLALTGVVGEAPAPNNSLLRFQTRSVVHPTAGPITQLIYSESSPLNLIGVVDVFKPTDFDRDGDEDTTDMSAFAAVLTPIGVPADVADGRYDLTGDGVVDYKDVRAAQRFQLFLDGDANFDGFVNFGDLLALAQNYQGEGLKVWTEGDFNGSETVDFDDLLTMAHHYGGSSLSLAEGDQLGAAFAADWALAQSLVPEPTALVSMGAVALLARRRRR